MYNFLVLPCFIFNYLCIRLQFYSWLLVLRSKKKMWIYFAFIHHFSMRCSIAFGVASFSQSTTLIFGLKTFAHIAKSSCLIHDCAESTISIKFSHFLCRTHNFTTISTAFMNLQRITHIDREV